MKESKEGQKHKCKISHKGEKTKQYIYLKSSSSQIQQMQNVTIKIKHVMKCQITF